MADPGESGEVGVTAQNQVGYGATGEVGGRQPVADIAARGGDPRMPDRN